ncbi:hypothetical protein ABPG72_010775 [Tetrahymena utriculariae]
MSLFKLEFAKSITSSFKELEKRDTNAQKSYQKIQQKLNYRSGKDSNSAKDKSFFDVLTSKSGPDLIYSFLNQRIRLIAALRSTNLSCQAQIINQNMNFQNSFISKGNTMREFQPNQKIQQTLFVSQEQQISQSQSQQQQQQQLMQQQGLPSQQQSQTYHNYENQEINIENIDLDEFKLVILLREILIDCSEITATDIIDLFEAKPNQKIGFQEIYLIIVYVASIESNQQLEYLNMFGNLLFNIIKSTSNSIYGSRIRQISKLFGFQEKKICKAFKNLNIVPQNLYLFDIFELYFFMIFSDVQSNQINPNQFINQNMINKSSIPNSPQKMNFQQTYVQQHGINNQQQIQQTQLIQQQQQIQNSINQQKKIQQNQNCTIF